MSNLVTPAAQVYPAVAVPQARVSAREAMVAALMTYLGELTFQRGGAGAERFRVKPRNLLDEWPDTEHRFEYPTLCVVGSPGRYLSNLTPAVDESSFGVHAPGTALVQDGEYSETLQLVGWGSDRGERRALVAGVEAGASPSDGRRGLSLRTEGYFGRTCRLTLTGYVLVEDEAVRGSRRVDFAVEGRVPVVRLAAFRRLGVGVVVEVDGRELDSSGHWVVDEQD